MHDAVRQDRWALLSVGSRVTVKQTLTQTDRHRDTHTQRDLKKWTFIQII